MIFGRLSGNLSGTADAKFIGKAEKQKIICTRLKVILLWDGFFIAAQGKPRKNILRRNVL